MLVLGPTFDRLLDFYRRRHVDVPVHHMVLVDVEEASPVVSPEGSGGASRRCASVGGLIGVRARGTTGVLRSCARESKSKGPPGARPRYVAPAEQYAGTRTSTAQDDATRTYET
jgi:hypothetical protein